jgi:hypothetical protein
MRLSRAAYYHDRLAIPPTRCSLMAFPALRVATPNWEDTPMPVPPYRVRCREAGVG